MDTTTISNPIAQQLETAIGELERKLERKKSEVATAKKELKKYEKALRDLTGEKRHPGAGKVEK